LLSRTRTCTDASLLSQKRLMGPIPGPENRLKGRVNITKFRVC